MEITSILDARVSGIVFNTIHPDPLPPTTRAMIQDLLQHRNHCPDTEVPLIDEQILTLIKNNVTRIKRQQFGWGPGDVPYTEQDIKNMNSQFQEILDSLKDICDELTENQWIELFLAIEHEVTGNYDRELGYAPGDCIPIEWQRVISRLRKGK
jgi:hypothetical protein